MPRSLSTQPNRYFGDRLSAAISAVASRQGLRKQVAQEKLAQAVGEQVGASLSYHAVVHWQRGFPPNCERVQAIVCYCIQEGLISYDFAKELCTSANCEHLVARLDLLFPQRRLPQERQIFNDLPFPNPRFIGRDPFLQTLREDLTSGPPIARIQAITGLGGVGKTQLAVEYVSRYGTEYDVIWWMRAGKQTDLPTAYASLAGPLQLLESATSTPVALHAAVRRWLEQHPRWLLVFDDAAEVQAVSNYLPRGGSGHVLITSRNPNWRSVATPLPVGVLDRRYSVTFLQERTGKYDAAAADALAERLGDLPLALEQAGAYIEMTDSTFDAYLEHFVVNHEELLRRSAPPPDAARTVATTWELAFQQIQCVSQTAVDFLHMCAFLAPDNIHHDMLQAGRQSLPESLALAIQNTQGLQEDAIIATLRNYSLIERTEGAFSVHPLVQAVIRDHLPADVRHTWIERTVALLQAALTHVHGDMHAWATYAHLLPHALQVAEYARTLLPLTPDRAQRELALRLTLGPKLMGTRGYGDPEVQRNYNRAKELCQQEHLTPQLFPALFGLWTFYHLHAQHQEAEMLGQQLLILAKQADTPDLLAEAHLSRGCTLLARGEFHRARRHLDFCSTHCAPEHLSTHTDIYGQDPAVASLCHGSHVLWLLGYPEQALNKSCEARTRAKEGGYLFNRTFAEFFTTILYYFCRDVEKVRQCAESTLHLATQHGFRSWEVIARILRGWALTVRAKAGDMDMIEGMELMRQGVAAWRAMGSRLALPIHLVQQAEGAKATGQVEKGLGFLSEAQQAINETKECWWQAEILRCTGEFQLRHAAPDVQQAEASFRQALKIARRQQAKSLELRAAVSLARLWRQQGKQTAAYELLAPIYGWFTEGFDTTDLQEAKALLEALGS
jgi:predicted ATPase